VNADASQGFANLVELERFDDGNDQLHGFLSGRIFVLAMQAANDNPPRRVPARVPLLSVSTDRLEIKRVYCRAHRQALKIGAD